MKKILLSITILMASLSTFAQSDIPFANYTPIIIDRNGNRTNTDGTTYNNDDLYPKADPAEMVTTRGYYYNKKQEKWSSILIKLKVGEKFIKLSAIKGAYGWQNKDYYAKEVSITDSEFVRENFTYRVYTPDIGMIYF